MSNVSLRRSGKKAFIYILIILVVACINLFANKKYILDALDFKVNRVKESDTDILKPLVEPDFYKKRINVRRGQSIDIILLKEDISQSEVYNSSQALRKLFDPRDLKVGTPVTVFYNWQNRSEFVGYEFNTSYDKGIAVFKNDNGKYESSFFDIQFGTKINRFEGVISNSLYGSALSLGVSENVIMNLTLLYSFDVDFQRDILKGTKFKIIYEDYTDTSGKVVKHGNILAANLIFEDRSVPIYRYTTSDGKTDYFDEEGKSARKSLLKTPINGAYVSSNYGMRKHPISGFTAFHRGTDFAAKTGTPIFASGDGVITRAIRSNKGYGIHIMIRHPNGYETLYGHMSAHARGMKKGVRVTQGQVIGYVGSTGMSTGPHLHYETRFNGEFVNPNSIKIPPGKTLKGDELEDFKKKIVDFKVTD